MRNILFLIFVLLLTTTIMAADVGFIVRNSANLDANEITLRDFLQSEGHTISILDDSVMSVNNQVIVVSNSVDSVAFAAFLFHRY